jgi:hypothetical protein
MDIMMLEKMKCGRMRFILYNEGKNKEQMAWKLKKISSIY